MNELTTAVATLVGFLVGYAGGAFLVKFAIDAYYDIKDGGIWRK